ncbi:hypothetical protein ABKN59_010848 [Abortiporus biennis]
MTAVPTSTSMTPVTQILRESSVSTPPSHDESNSVDSECESDILAESDDDDTSSTSGTTNLESRLSSMSLEEPFENDIRTYEGELEDTERERRTIGKHQLTYTQASCLLDFLRASYKEVDPSPEEWEGWIVANGVGYEPDVIRVNKEEAAQWYEAMKRQGKWDEKPKTFYEFVEVEIRTGFARSAESRFGTRAWVARDGGGKATRASRHMNRRELEEEKEEIEIAAKTFSRIAQPFPDPYVYNFRRNKQYES